MPYLDITDEANRAVMRINLDTQPPFRFDVLQPDGRGPLPDAQNNLQVRALGSGGFGVVVRARDRLSVDRAVKFLRHSPEENFEELRNEIRDNQRIPKKHTAPITSWGSTRAASGEDIWYYVMPLLPGDDLDAFIAQLFHEHQPSSQGPAEVVHGLRAVVLRLFQEVLLGLEELEYEQLAHMDVSPRNIRVLTPSRVPGSLDLSILERELKVFLIDLGVARRYGPDPTLPRMPLRCNPTFFLPPLVDAVTVSKGAHFLVDPVKLASLGSRVDLFLFGRMLDLLFDGRLARASQGTTVAEAIKTQHDCWRLVLGDQYDFLRLVAKRLQDLGSTSFKSAADVRELFEALMTPRVGSGYDSALLSDHQAGVHLRVPEGLVQVAYPLNRVVDHPFFQRLRNLKQLAFIDRIYPGATHSRFTHSLQVFDLMKRYVGSLSHDSHFRLEFQRPQVDTLLTAALVHDLGHYPFAHTIEDLRKLGDLSIERIAADTTLGSAEQQRRIDQLHSLTSIRHDHELTAGLLSREAPGWRAGTQHTLAALLTAHGIDVSAVCYMIAKSEQTPDARPFERLGRDLVAGIIDADRLSYLRLDSHQTGVKFGLAVDVEGIIENLRVRPSDDVGNIALGINEVAVPAVEAVLAGVYWMYQNVYWHPRNRAFMAAVKRCFQRLLLSGTISFEQYWQDTLFASDDTALSTLVSKYDAWLRTDHPIPEQSFNPLAPLSSGLRLPLEPVWELGQSTHDPRPGQHRPHDAEHHSLYDVIVGRWTPWVEEDLCVVLARALFNNAALAEHILFDIPLKPRLRSEGLAPSARTAEEALAQEETVAELHNKKTRLWVFGQDPRTMARDRWLRLGERSSFAALLWSLEDVETRKVRMFVSRKLWRDIRQPNEFRSTVTRAIEAFFSFPHGLPEAP